MFSPPILTKWYCILYSVINQMSFNTGFLLHWSLRPPTMIICPNFGMNDKVWLCLGGGGFPIILG